jgi:hypothetical protein
MQPEIDELHRVDHQLAAAVHAHDEQRVHQLLGQMIALARTRGAAVLPNEVVPSDAVLPPSTITLDEVQSLLHDNSLVESAGPAD